MTSAIEKILGVTIYAIAQHGDQKRKGDGSPYILHPLQASLILHKVGVDDLEILQAAILHDVVEDTKGTLDDLRLLFGERVAHIVAEVTDDKSLAKIERKKLQVVHAETMSRDAKLVKMADKLSNLTDLTVTPPRGWSLERVQGYFVWAAAVVDRMRGTNDELERALDCLFSGAIQFEGQTYPAIPPAPSRAEQLENYYAGLIADEMTK